MPNQILNFKDLKIEFEQKERITQGETSILRYKLTNNSEEILILAPGLSRYGSIQIREEKAYHNTMAQIQSPPVFFPSINTIFPNSTLEKSIEVRTFQSGKIKYKLLLNYLKLKQSDVNNIFINESEKGSPLTGAPGTIIYRRIRNLNELKDNLLGELLIPENYQNKIKKSLEFEIELEVEPNKNVQELYTQYTPTNIIELKELMYTILETDKGTLLLREGKTINIGMVEPEALKRIDDRKDKKKILIWVEPEKGPIEKFLKKHGKENLQDQMYHGNFPYYLELPKTELIEFLECIRKGNYRMVAGHGMFYENDVWVLK